VRKKAEFTLRRSNRGAASSLKKARGLGLARNHVSNAGCDNRAMNGIGGAATTSVKVGRNDPCPCGSGKKFKLCCERKRAELFACDTDTGVTSAKQRLQALRRVAGEHCRAQRWAEALPHLQEIVWLDPNEAWAHYELGDALVRLGSAAGAVESLKRALELKPGLDEALAPLAYALERSGRNFEAAPVYRKLSKITSSPVERLRHCAVALALEGKIDEAVEQIRRLLVLAPNDAHARFVLGTLLAQRGDFEEAAREILPTLEALPAAFEMFSAAKPMTEADRPLIDRMARVSKMQTLEPKARISLHFGLGKAFNDLAEYGEAMRHYDAANGLRARTMRLDRPALVRLYDDIIRAFPGETLERAGRPETAPAGASELPVLIVGMPRSGTTLVERIVSAHPAVAAGGELPFWSTRIRDMRIGLGPISDAGALSKAAEDYGAVLRRIDAHALRVTDKAGANFEGLGLIRLAFPDARIIHCRRHPIDTALSIYFSNFGGHAFANDRGDIVFFYRQYEKLMDFWRSVLRPDRFTEVEYERLIADREMQTRRLIDFLGLSWDEACMTPERNARAVQTASVWQARQPVYETSVERWRRYESWLGELKELMPRSAAP
jgi:Flp pilus assembly protein TadD